MKDRHHRYGRSRINNTACSAMLAAGIACLVATACGQAAPQECQPLFNPAPSYLYYQYVLDSLLLPTTAEEISSFALNLDEDAEDSPDNIFGSFLVELASSLDGFDLAANASSQVLRGHAINLIQLRTDSFGSAAGVATWVLPGENPSVAPCADETDTVCGRHLEGTASFQPDIEEPEEFVLLSGILANTLYAGTGGNRAVLQVPIFSDLPPLTLQLVASRIQTDFLSAERLSGTIAGAIAADDIESGLIANLLSLLNDAIAGCSGSPEEGNPCGCATEMPRSVVSVFDANTDCTISAGELLSSSIGDLLRPDVDLFGSSGLFDPGRDGILDSLSVGVHFSAVPAEFPVLPLPPGALCE